MYVLTFPGATTNSIREITMTKRLTIIVIITVLFNGAAEYAEFAIVCLRKHSQCKLRLYKNYIVLLSVNYRI